MFTFVTWVKTNEHKQWGWSIRTRAHASERSAPAKERNLHSAEQEAVLVGLLIRIEIVIAEDLQLEHGVVRAERHVQNDEQGRPGND